MRRLVPFIVTATVVFATAAVVMPSIARADVADEHEARQRLFRRGLAALEAKQWQRALAIYQKLWTESRTYDVALSLAQAELNLKRYRDAAEHLHYGIRNIAPREKIEFTEHARKLLAAAQQHVGTLEIHSNTHGADILVDDELEGQAPLRALVFVEPGTHHIEARAGDRHASEKLEVRAGETYPIHLELAPSSQASPEATAGEGSKAAPVASSEAERDPGKINTNKPGWPYWVAGVVATAGLGVGVGFQIAVSSDEEELRNLARDLRARGGDSACVGDRFTRECDEILDTMDDVDRRGRIAAGGFITLGVGVAGLLTYWAVPESAFTQTGFSIGPRHATVSWGGEF